MDDLKAAFEEVADWCERHLEEQRGREIGMTFGAMLRAYGRLAALPARLADCQRMPEARKLNVRAEAFLGRLSTRFLLSSSRMEMRIPMVEPTSLPMNMTYDTGARIHRNDGDRS